MLILKERFFFDQWKQVARCFSSSLHLLLLFRRKWPYSSSTTAAIVASAQSNNYSLPAKVTFSLSLLEQIARDAQRSVAPYVCHNVYCTSGLFTKRIQIEI